MILVEGNNGQTLADGCVLLLCANIKTSLKRLQMSAGDVGDLEAASPQLTSPPLTASQLHVVTPSEDKSLPRRKPGPGMVPDWDGAPPTTEER